MRNFILLTFLWVQVYVFGQTGPISVISPEESVKMALENNPAVVNQSLRIEQSQLMRKVSWDFESTGMKYRSGQLYGPERDRYLEINQGFGSLLEHIHNYRLADKQLQLSKTEYNLARKNLIAEVNSTYYYWVYTYNRLIIQEQQSKVFSDIERIADLQYKNGDIDLLERTALVTEAASVETGLNILYDELEMARNKVKQLIVTDAEILPSMTELSMYKINRASDTRMYQNHILASYYKSLTELNDCTVASKSAAFFPELSFGIINQHIAPYSGLWAWQLELSIPVLFFTKKAEVQRARLETQISENEYEYQLFAINKTIENLVLELEMIFKKLIYFDQYALLEAEQIVQTATRQLEKEEIGYIEYARRIAESLSTKLEYLEILNHYNQTAIQLEFYAN
ncbi:MAG: TolC family protein [Bacteroidales bacterium]|nr:TolC family protein [Bacteroidales bacterium]